jgi:acetoacetyl-CoA synthetase
MVAEGEWLWSPSPEFAAQSNIAKFQAWLVENQGVATTDYSSLWQWSVEHPDAFWRAIWNYFDVRYDGTFDRVRDRTSMLGVRWFDGARVNYVEHLLRYAETASPGETAFHHLSECRSLAGIEWGHLLQLVRNVANRLRDMGVTPGDRVVSYMPNVLETAVAMMAAGAIGAVWSSAAIEFGPRTVIDRFQQIAPKVLFVADGYRFAGRDLDRHEAVTEVVQGLTTLQHVVWLPYLNSDSAVPEMACQVTAWAEIARSQGSNGDAFAFERVACDHPLWVVFSSGTTGLPKPIVHSHVGILVEHLKVMHFHLNLRPGATMFFYSTTGWMMWNLLLATLLTGAAAVLYDGSPSHPRPDRLWQLAADVGATSFGASPTYVQAMERAMLDPGRSFDLSRLESIVVSGAPSTPETFDWFYRCVKRDLWVTSQSGGTELCSGFVGATPTLPVYAGEIQARMLGMDVHVWDDHGRDLVDEIGELVVTTSFPSMPICFWNDSGNARYQASYFERYPGVWHHGDYMKLNSRGGCYIYGRSDATLNRSGVRIGTAEIYRTLEAIPEVADSLIVCCNLPDGRFFMPLFLKLQEEISLDAALTERIASRLRQDCSPRHVPDGMYAVPAIPYTLTGKKMEVPVRRILMGIAADSAASKDATLNGDTLGWFERFARENSHLRSLAEFRS